MEDVLKENERLKREVECLTSTLNSVWSGLDKSVDYWRQHYLELLRDSLATTNGRGRGC